MSCTISGTFLNPDGSALANGELALTLSQNAVETGTGWVVPQYVTVALNSSGAIPAATTIIGNDSLTPAGTTYNVRVISAGDVYFDIGSFSITGGTFNFNTSTPSGGGITYPFAVLQNPTSPQTITGQPLTLTSSAPLNTQGLLTATGGITAGKINNVFTVDGVQFTTVQAAMDAANALGGGTVFVPPGTYVGPATPYSGVAVIGLTPSMGFGFSGQTQQVKFTYTSAGLLLLNISNSVWENIYFDFSGATSAINLELRANTNSGNAFCIQNVFRNCTLFDAGGPSLPSLLLSASGSGSFISNGFNTFDNVMIYGNNNQSVNVGPSLCAIQLIGSGTVNNGPSVTQNRFNNIYLRGGLQGGTDLERNSDTNYFRSIAVQQEWSGTALSNTYALGFNLANPTIEQDANACSFYGVNTTGSFTNVIRAGQTSGHIIDMEGASSTPPSVAVLGGTPQFVGTVANLSAASSFIYGFNGGYTMLGGPAFRVQSIRADLDVSLAVSNFTLSTSPTWGAGASVSGVASSGSQSAALQINTGTSPAANPTVTITFPKSYTTSPVCQLVQNGGTHAVGALFVQTAFSASSATFTFTGAATTPTGSKTIQCVFSVLP